MYIHPKSLPATEIIGGCIAVWENAWPNTQKTILDLEKAISETAYTNWNDAWTLGGVGKRTNKDFGLKTNAREHETIRTISNDYYSLIASSAEWYANHFKITEPIYTPEEFNVLKYQTGQEYEAHYDGSTLTKRVISPILYLNDDYIGGELEFVNQKITIKPKAGTFYIFPANFAFAHIAHPVKEGTKYAIVTWLHDQP
jgi:predicted 2-oxoglutarate/Fe(II)-dependent dioxygenase YbiX